MNKSLIVLGIVLIVVVGAAGLYVSGFFNSPSMIEVRIGCLDNDLHQLALHVAIANGYFEQNGIKIKLFSYSSGPTLMQSFLAGDLDFAYVGAPPAINGRAAALAGSSSNIPVIVASVNLEGSTLVTSSAISSISDLNNKVIGTPGTGTIQDILLSTFILNNNLTVTKSPALISTLPILFSNGEINGFIAWEPVPSVAISQSGAQVLLTSHDLMPNHQCCVLVASNKIIASNPAIVTKVVQIHKNATDYINSNPASAKLIAGNYTQLSQSVIDIAFSHVAYNYTVNVDSMKTFLLQMIQLGTVTTVNSSQVDSFIDNFVDTSYG
jgi:NitT/TauT family transport system substrate-binding protein